MSLFKKLPKVFTTWRSSSSASSAKLKNRLDDYLDAKAYLTERMCEEEAKNLQRRINSSMTHPAMNAAAQSMNMNNVGAAISGHPMWPHQTSGVGMGAVNQAWPQGGLTADREVIRNTIKQFTVEKVDNGFILRSGKYSKICKDMEELSQQFIATIVEQQLDK